MRYFDYGFLRGKDVSAYAVRMIADVALSQGQNTYRKDKLGKLFSALENVAKIESVKSSNAIEGNTLTLRVTDNSGQGGTGWGNCLLYR